ncbi:NADH-quinone oxidoreductase subunit NuoE [Aliikangiella maris]|uniref:NADH-quinone oxidoreductase subunit E n=2 Tax=Aliikangiella maris TaxID=3162458 RepID=A0ABV2BRI2_9GAMM
MTDLTYDNKLHLKNIVPPEAIAEVDHWISKYPAERKRPPIMAALKVVQQHNGNYLTDEMMQAVAEYLDVPHIAVYEVATFYTLFHLNKVGKHVISVCNNISCTLRGANQILQHLQNRLNIKVGETTEDGLYTIQTVECMAACGGAPMLEVNKVYYENLTEEKVDQILSEIAQIELNQSTEDKGESNSPDSKE